MRAFANHWPDVLDHRKDEIQVSVIIRDQDGPHVNQICVGGRKLLKLSKGT